MQNRFAKVFDLLARVDGLRRDNHICIGRERPNDLYGSVGLVIDDKYHLVVRVILDEQRLEILTQPLI